jgi:hypothetical protein
MIEKKLDTEFQEAVTIALNDSGIFTAGCPATSPTTNRLLLAL